MKKTRLVLSILAMPLLASLLLVGVTSSTGVYNPWCDQDSDGDIDIYDIVQAAMAYGTTGDPGKNITVTNWPTNTLAFTVSTTLGGYESLDSPWIPVNGYSRISICLFNGAPFEPSNFYRLQARHSEGSHAFYVEALQDLPSDFVKICDVPNEEVQVHFANNDAGPLPVNLDIYLIR
jgi:hypothetical protein